MGRGSTTMGSLRVVAVACLCVAVAAAVQFGPYFVKMLTVYREGPSIGAALNSDAMQILRYLMVPGFTPWAVSTSPTRYPVTSVSTSASR